MDQMPQISYNRDHKNSYMIIEGETDNIGYEEQMLRENEVRMLLAFYTVEMNRKIQLWYEITGKRSLRSLVEQDGLSLENLQMILGAMYTSLRGVRNYLIPDDHLYLTRDTIFFAKSDRNWEAYLCWCPFPLPPLSEQIRSIMEFFMSTVEKERSEVSDLCRELYDMSIEDASIDQLVELAAVYHSKTAGSLDESREQDFHPCESDRNTDTLSESESIISFEHPLQSKDDNMQKAKKLPTLFKKPEAGVQFDLLSAFNNKMSELKQIVNDFLSRIFGKPAKIDARQIPDEGIIIFEPDDDYHEPTTLLRTDDREFMGELVYIGSGNESNYLINKDVFNIGARDEENDANLNSPVVSRHHARITRDENGYTIQDLNSTNGTYVNDKILSYEEKVILKRTDKIRFADVTYKII